MQVFLTLNQFNMSTRWMELVTSIELLTSSGLKRVKLLPTRISRRLNSKKRMWGTTCPHCSLGLMFYSCPKLNTGKAPCRKLTFGSLLIRIILINKLTEDSRSSTLKPQRGITITPFWTKWDTKRRLRLKLNKKWIIRSRQCMISHKKRLRDLGLSMLSICLISTVLEIKILMSQKERGGLFSYNLWHRYKPHRTDEAT